jgi:hypothetical protein
VGHVERSVWAICCGAHNQPGICDTKGHKSPSGSSLRTQRALVRWAWHCDPGHFQWPAGSPLAASSPSTQRALRLASAEIV